ncbi:TIGR03619 family F420-dependent LLM class oxidoreductase [Nocardia jinanensis]|uniref:LLM class F420-dependent oxidoreductase n=1 Tax=Nocardia jinanensis TaxID=382504 RepID=A0A917VL53_9NOCA|nr:TIGR03619 family F420-dependent LLM class oxidoreductase [Nocardia jinanensis]GGK91951.1 LLM class F420-dependent oxidoreductase [Nocardia jinanensis]
MRIGLSTPIVVRVPEIASPWEVGGGPAELTRIAETADDLGFDHLTCSEHIAVPAAEAAARGSTYWDPLATLSYLAARTTRIRLATSVVVLGYHHPLALAKSYGTLDRLSGGRVVLGVGVGSLEAEFALLDAQWAERGTAADRALAVLRVAWGRREVGDFVLDPPATSTTAPLWVGGRTRRSLRRAVTLGSGWVPFGLPADALAAYLAAVSRPSGFEVVLSPGRALDPLADPGGTRRRLTGLRDIGATVACCAVRATDIDHYCDQLAALIAVAAPL